MKEQHKVAKQAMKQRCKEAKQQCKAEIQAAKQALKQTKQEIKLSKKAAKHQQRSAAADERTAEMDFTPSVAEETEKKPAEVQLGDMGFTNTELNAQLLAENNGNLEAVILALLAMKA